jgi:hypothetical protein
MWGKDWRVVRPRATPPFMSAKGLSGVTLQSDSLIANFRAFLYPLKHHSCYLYKGIDGGVVQNATVVVG